MYGLNRILYWEADIPLDINYMSFSTGRHDRAGFYFLEDTGVNRQTLTSIIKISHYIKQSNTLWFIILIPFRTNELVND